MMRRIRRFVGIVGMAVTVWGAPGAMAYAAEPLELHPEQYQLSGMVGTALGFGLGHAVRGDFKQRGWVFTATESVGLGLAIAGVVRADHMIGDYGFVGKLGWGLLLSGLTIHLGARIWEIVDIWTTATVPAWRVTSGPAVSQRSVIVAPWISNVAQGAALSARF